MIVELILDDDACYGRRGEFLCWEMGKDVGEVVGIFRNLAEVVQLL